MEGLSKRDRDVLEVLSGGRCNPMHIRENTGLDKGQVNSVLVKLARDGLANRIERGLYEITKSGREEIGKTTDYRAMTLDEKGAVCANCGGADNLEVHHLDGDRTNNELENLLPLCRDCHRKLHSCGLEGLEEYLLPPEEREHIDPSTTSFQFSIGTGDWDAWKDTVPRSKTLDERIRELIKADTEGRVLEETETLTRERSQEPTHEAPEPATPAAPVDVPQDADLRERLDGLDFPDPQDPDFIREDRVDLLATIYQRLEDADGGWVTRDELRDLFKTMPAGYSSEDSWYERFIREWLPELDEVEKSGQGASGMRIAG